MKELKELSLEELENINGGNWEEDLGIGVAGSAIYDGLKTGIKWIMDNPEIFM